MAIITSKKVNVKTPTGRVLDIRGQDGNAFVIIARAKYFSELLQHTDNEFRAIRSEMISSDYENLLQVFDENYGEYIDIVR